MPTPARATTPRRYTQAELDDDPGVAAANFPTMIPIVDKAHRVDIEDFDPVPLRHREDGWTPGRQRMFLGLLADFACVEKAAQCVHMTERSAYRLRRRAGAESFAAAWDRALHENAAKLEDRLMNLALNGREEAVFHQGKQVGTRQVFSERLLLAALARTDKRAAQRARAAGGERLARQAQAALPAPPLALAAPASVSTAAYSRKNHAQVEAGEAGLRSAT